MSTKDEVAELRARVSELEKADSGAAERVTRALQRVGDLEILTSAQQGRIETIRDALRVAEKTIADLCERVELLEIAVRDREQRAMELVLAGMRASAAITRAATGHPVAPTLSAYECDLFSMCVDASLGDDDWSRKVRALIKPRRIVTPG